MAYLASELAELLRSIVLHQKELQVTLSSAKPAEELIENLLDIKLELADAEKKQWQEARIKNWLQELKEVCYGLDDAVDEWSVAVLTAESKGAKSKSMVRAASRYSSCLPGGKHLRPDIYDKIKHWNAKLGNLVHKKVGFNFNFEKNIDNIIDCSVILHKPTVRGTYPEKVVEKLQSSLDHDVILLVGDGGIGKTTVAQSVFYGQNISGDFDTRIWVSVSQRFDEAGFSRKMHVSLSGSSGGQQDGHHHVMENKEDSFKGIKERTDSSSSGGGGGQDDHHHDHVVENKEDLFKCIKEWTGESKRFLLVLDDVWEVDEVTWKSLVGPLQSGLLSGSKILVTTRNQDIANHRMERYDTVLMEELSDEDCWLIFSEIAFEEKNGGGDKGHEKLEKIGRDIVNMCKGVPFAAKAVGSFLRNKKPDEEEWQAVLYSPFWEHGVFAPLLMSYYELSAKMRQCFLYSAVFSKFYEWEKDELISLWMAQGYLRASEGIEMEGIGERYFNNLKARSFIEEFKEKEGTTIKCRMDGLVHDFGQLCLSNESAYGEKMNSKAILGREDSHAGVKHLWVGDFDLLKKDLSDSLISLRTLRSLIVTRGTTTSDNNEGIDLPQAFLMLTSLRALRLSGINLGSVPPEIWLLVHLRYLNLSHNKNLKQLPEEICYLYNLHTLDITSCCLIKALPDAMGKLINLRHLRNSGATGLGQMPKGIASLNSLRTLNLFVVGGKGDDLGCLRFLTELRNGLEIKGLGEYSITEVQAKEAQLKNKRLLKALVLRFDRKNEEEEEGNSTKNKEKEEEGTVLRSDYQVLQSLEPPPGLESLEIHEYEGSFLAPAWLMSMSNLGKVTLSFCKNCWKLPMLGRLPNLVHLAVEKMQRVERVGTEFLGKYPISKSPFPKLQSIKFSDMDNWEEWSFGILEGNTEELVMPSLQNLHIEGCPKLRKLPNKLLRNNSLKRSFLRCPKLKTGQNGQEYRLSHIHTDPRSINPIASRGASVSSNPSLSMENL
ncbi:hypothetical protein Tsubulata_014349 [Turnera subulata]|uniref:NB-ARC domain-containing protein n=1 Tax=Turnera subulata TaxID=218843 RepID=A0A9Q0F781_9ROSI|nr:hypothetical protein Tsubulata_014349 [Turnera subulata]